VERISRFWLVEKRREDGVADPVWTRRWLIVCVLEWNMSLEVERIDVCVGGGARIGGSLNLASVDL
jgi:hypothetical protein